MQLNKWTILLISVVFVALVVWGGYLFSFPKLEITVDPSDSVLYVDGVKVANPFSKRVLRGKHQLEARSEGYATEKREVTAPSGKVEIALVNNKDKFIETLPIYQENFDIEYNTEEGFFYILIKKEPIDEVKAEAAKELSKNKIDISREQIIYDYISGVNGRTGP